MEIFLKCVLLRTVLFQGYNHSWNQKEFIVVFSDILNFIYCLLRFWIRTKQAQKIEHDCSSFEAVLNWLCMLCKNYSPFSENARFTQSFTSQFSHSWQLN